MTLRQLLGSRIETERLILIRMTPKNANLIWNLYKEKGVKWYFPNRETLPTRKDIKYHLSCRCSPHFAIIHKNAQEFLGFIEVDVWSEYFSGVKEFCFSYFLHQKYEKNGYMSEAVSAVCRKMKKYRTPYRVNLCIDNKNKKSLRVAQKCGFDWKDTCFTNIYSLVPPRHEKFLNNTIEKIDWNIMNLCRV